MRLEALNYPHTADGGTRFGGAVAVGIYWIPAVLIYGCLPDGVLWKHFATPLPIMKTRTRNVLRTSMEMVAFRGVETTFIPQMGRLD